MLKRCEKEKLWLPEVTEINSAFHGGLINVMASSGVKMRMRNGEKRY